jgi:hypothetical protein
MTQKCYAALARSSDAGPLGRRARLADTEGMKVGRAAATIGAGAISGFAVQTVACGVLFAVWSASGATFAIGSVRFVGLLAGFGAVVGAISALLGERIFLRPLSIAELWEAWPKLAVIALASAVVSTQLVLLFAWATNPAVFLAGCAWVRRDWERRARAKGAPERS